MTEEWNIMPFLYWPLTGYWLPDYMKDYEIQLRWYCKLACITEKKNTKEHKTKRHNKKDTKKMKLYFGNCHLKWSINL